MSGIKRLEENKKKWKKEGKRKREGKEEEMKKKGRRQEKSMCSSLQTSVVPNFGHLFIGRAGRRIEPQRFFPSLSCSSLGESDSA